MLAVALSMAVLFEVSVFLAYLNDKRRGKLGAEAAYAELDDDETSPLELDDVDPGVDEETR